MILLTMIGGSGIFAVIAATGDALAPGRQTPRSSNCRQWRRFKAVRRWDDSRQRDGVDNWGGRRECGARCRRRRRWVDCPVAGLCSEFTPQFGTLLTSFMYSDSHDSSRRCSPLHRGLCPLALAVVILLSKASPASSLLPYGKSTYSRSTSH